MTETMLNGAQEQQAVPPSPEVLGAIAQGPDASVSGMAATAIEQVMRTDPAAAFEFPKHVIKAGNDVTYTPPSGDK